MTDNFIKLNKDDILRLEIKTSDGKSTGNYLEFDLEDIDLFLKYQELIEENEKSRKKLRNELLIIEKRQDVKGKKLLTKNQEDVIKTIKRFFEREEEIYDIFLGEGGFKKLLNGRNVTWDTLEQIDKLIEEQILPHLDLKMEKITDKIKNKYNNFKKNNEVLK